MLRTSPRPLRGPPLSERRGALRTCAEPGPSPLGEGQAPKGPGRGLPALLLLAACATTQPAPAPADPPDAGSPDAGSIAQLRPPPPRDCVRTFCGCWTPLTLSVQGTALDAETGQPLAASIATDEGQPLGAADDAGHFAVRYETEWSPGCKLKGRGLRFSAPGHEVALEPFGLVGPTHTEVALEAALFPEGGGAPAEGDEGVCGWGPKHPGRLELEVVDAAGQPVVGAYAAGAESDSAGKLVATTQVRGSAHCGTSPHRIQVDRSGVGRGSAPVRWLPSDEGYQAKARVVLR